MGTVERWQHGRMGREFRAAEGGRAGGVVGARDAIPLVLDQLYLDGHLGASEPSAERRRAAGEWLHECWGKAGMNGSVVAAYEKRTDKSEGMSDAEQWNRRAYNEAMDAMKPYGRTVEIVCCDNKMAMGPSAIADLRTGLDLLAKYRGIA